MYLLGHFPWVFSAPAGCYKICYRSSLRPTDLCEVHLHFWGSGCKQHLVFQGSLIVGMGFRGKLEFSFQAKS